MASLSPLAGKPTLASAALITKGLAGGCSGPLGFPTSIHHVYFLGVHSLCMVGPSNFRPQCFSSIETMDAIVVR